MENSLPQKSESLKNPNEKDTLNSKKIYGPVFVIMIILLISFEYYVYCFLIITPNLNSRNSNSIIFTLFLFHIFLGLMVWSLTVTMMTHPGEVPLYWGFYIGDDNSKRKRYCLICNAFKPERSHHCSICNICILNMDHHCPWLNNCIGFYNRKYFLQFLFYLTFVSLFIVITGFSDVFRIVQLFYFSKIKVSELLGSIVIIFGYTIVLVVSFKILFFLKFHLRLVVFNVTTIESLEEKVWIENRYNINPKFNWSQVFGENKLLWFFPIILESGLPRGDGLNWMSNESEIKENPNVVNENNHNASFQRSNTPVNFQLFSPSTTIPLNKIEKDIAGNSSNISEKIISNFDGRVSMKKKILKGSVNDYNSTKGLFSPQHNQNYNEMIEK